MVERERWGRLSELVAQPQLTKVLLEHAYRGIRVQFVLRGVLVVFLALTVTLAPPEHDRVTSWVIAGAYLCWVLALVVVVRGADTWPVRHLWLALYADVAALAALTLVAGNSAVQSWTADILIDGFFLLPVMAATQLRPWVCVSVCAPTTAVYIFSSIATRTANGEPWASLWLRAGVFTGLAAGCVLLSRVQQSRVITIGRLVADRTRLLEEIVDIEERERRDLAEHLHDGALQYVLAARMDAEDARGRAEPESFDRLDHALTEASALLRSTVTQLHPAVLEQAGLRRAVIELADGYARRGVFTVEVDADSWPEDAKTTADALLYATARELLGNVLKHAGATRVRVALAWAGGTARVGVTDDGTGIPDGMLQQRLAEGHVGLASRRTRLEAAGGTLEVTTAVPHGTAVAVTMPASLLP